VADGSSSLVASAVSFCAARIAERIKGLRPRTGLAALQLPHPALQLQ